MPFEPVYENIVVSRQQRTTEEKIKAECATEISVESVSKIINLYAQAVVTDKEIIDGKLRYLGKVTFFACYETSDGSIQKNESTASFSGEIAQSEACERDCGVWVDVEKAEADLSGASLLLSARVTVRVTTREKTTARALQRGDGLIVKESEVSLIKSSGIKEVVYPIEEEIELNYRVEQVVSQRAQAVVTAVQCGVGAIILDGETHFSVVMLQSDGKSAIIREDRTIPFRAEIECEEAMPSSEAVAKACVKSFKTEIFVDDENGSSKIVANVLIKCEGEAFSEEIKSFAEDAFSPEYSVRADKIRVETVKPRANYGERLSVSERVAVDEIPIGAYIAATCDERAEIVSAETTDGILTVTGALSLNVLLTDADGKLSSRSIETPFECKIESKAAYENEAVCLTAISSRAKILSATEIEIFAEAALTVYYEESSVFSVTGEVIADGEKPKNDHAVSVYLALENEGLWDLAKRLGEYPQALLETNPELSFPLTGKERIVVYRQKRKSIGSM